MRLLNQAITCTIVQIGGIMKIRTCSCGNPIDENGLFCTSCGKKIEKLPPACENCGTPIESDALFCIKCGTKVESTPAIPVQPKAVPVPQPVPDFNDSKPIENNQNISNGESLADILPEEIKNPAVISRENQPSFTDITANSTDYNTAIDNAFPQNTAQPTIHIDGSKQDVESNSILQPAEKKKVSAKSVFTVILSVFLCIVLFGSTIGAELVLIVRQSVTSESIKSSIEKIDVSKIYVPSTVVQKTQSAFSSSDLQSESKNTSENSSKVSKAEKQTLPEYIMSIYDEEILNEYDIDEKKIEKLLEQDFVKDFVAEKVGGYADDLIKKTSEGELSTKEVVRFIEKNTDKIKDVTGYKVEQEDFDKITAFLDDNKVLENVSVASVSEQSPILIGVVRTAFSYFTFAALVVVALLLIFALFMLNKRSISNTAFYAGSSVFCAGGVLLVIGLMSSFVDNIVAKLLGDMAGIITPLLQPVYSGFVLAGIVTAGIGAILLIVSIAFSFLSNKNQGSVIKS